MNITFSEVPHGSSEWQVAVNLREQILRIPLGSYFTEEELAEEAHHHHIVGTMDGEIVATAVLVPENTSLKMQRVAVLESLRNQNIGGQLLNFCEAFGKKNGFDTMYCHARNTAVNFYSKNGYSSEGDYFDEDGIPHLKMKKRLSN